MKRLLDLFSGAGGCTRGYQMAGFYTVGVDKVFQPRYVGDYFIQADVMEWLPVAIETGYIDGFDVIHASPPCLLDNEMSRGRWQKKRLEHPDLIGPVRDLLIKTGKPYVIENVAGARHKFDSHLMLCGTMFGLETSHGNHLERHRYFEVFPHFLIMQRPCSHGRGSPIGVHGGGQHPKRRRLPAIGVYGNSGGSSSPAGTSFFGVDARREAMGIDWMTNDELSQAIPPKFTEYIGRKLLEAIE